jgi:ribonuclease Z
MYGPVGLERVVNYLRIIVGELPFDIVFHELKTGEEACFSCGGLDCVAFALDHGMPCFGYRLELKRAGRFDPVRAKERGVPVTLWSRLQKGESLEGYTPEDVLGEPRSGLKLLYATDSRPVPRMAELAENADLLILEGMFGETEKLERAKEARHMLMQEAARIAAEAKAKKLWLTHFSPANPEPEQFLEEIRQIFPDTCIGSDGLYTELRFPQT